MNLPHIMIMLKTISKFLELPLVDVNITYLIHPVNKYKFKLQSLHIAVSSVYGIDLFSFHFYLFPFVSTKLIKFIIYRRGKYTRLEEGNNL